MMKYWEKHIIPPLRKEIEKLLKEGEALTLNEIYDRVSDTPLGKWSLMPLYTEVEATLNVMVKDPTNDVRSMTFQNTSYARNFQENHVKREKVLQEVNQ